jgi:hypothetical protein
MSESEILTGSIGGGVKDLIDATRKPFVVNIEGETVLVRPLADGSWRADGGPLGWQEGEIGLGATQPEATPLLFGTLEGFSEFVTLEAQADEDHKLLIVVETSKRVVLFGPVDGDFSERRPILAMVKPSVLSEPFGFNRWHGSEEFVVNVNVGFRKSPDRDEVLRVASSIQKEIVSTSEDDGLTQVATIRAGISMSGKKAISPDVRLIPIGQTFFEAEETGISLPAVFRLQGGDASTTPRLGLWSVGWPEYERKAIAAIVSILRKRIGEWATVIG